MEKLLQKSLDRENIEKPNLVWHSKQLKQIFLNYFLRLLEHDSSEYSINLACGHLFLKTSSNCVCGLFNTENANSIDLDDDILLDSIDLSQNIFSNSDIHNQKRISSLKFIDCLESKLNALIVARDILATVLNVGVFIHDSF